MSKAGRDCGRHFVIIDTDDKGYVFVADGEFRKIAAPKRKNPKHLATLEDKLDIIAAKLNEGKQVFDAELRSALRKYNQK